MGDLLDHQEAPNTWSWTGRFAQFLPMQTTRSIHCAFNPAKGLQSVRGFWLRSASLCSLILELDPDTAACILSVYLKGQLHWQCDLNAAMAQCCLLTPEETQQGWVLAAAVADEGAPSKCCFMFEGEAQSCATVLQHVREQQTAHSRRQPQNQPQPELQPRELNQMHTETDHNPSGELTAAAHGISSITNLEPPQPAPAHTVPDDAATPVQPAAGGAPPPHHLLGNLLQMHDAALESEIQRCVRTPAFWSLVDRIEALWDELGLSASVARAPAGTHFFQAAGS